MSSSCKRMLIYCVHAGACLVSSHLWLVPSLCRYIRSGASDGANTSRPSLAMCLCQNLRSSASLR